MAEAERLYAQAANNAGLRPIGVAQPYRQPDQRPGPLEAAFVKMRALVGRLRTEGLGVERLDLGGGLGVPFFNQPAPPLPADLAAMIARTVGDLGLQFAFEPGRSIAANAGVLLARVIHVHERPEGRRFLVLDAAMNDLIRPAMYEAYHDIRRVADDGADAEPLLYDVVGPVCETGDTFARGRNLPQLAAGDLVAFMSAGAYGAAMSSEYNSRLLVPEVLVRGAQFAVVRPRPTYEQMLSRFVPLAAVAVGLVADPNGQGYRRNRPAIDRRHHLGHKRIIQLADGLGVTRLHGGDLRRPHHRRDGQARLGKSLDDMIAGPGAVLRAGDHRHPEEGIALSHRTVRDH